MLNNLLEFGRVSTFGLCLLIMSSRGVWAADNCPADIGNGVIGESAETVLEACLNTLATTLPGSEEEKRFKESIIDLVQINGLSPSIPPEYAEFKGLGETAVVIATEAEGFDEAASAFRKATRAAPWLPDVYYELGRSEEKAGNLKAAVSAYKLYLKAAPGAGNLKDVSTQIIALEYKDETETLAQGDIVDDNAIDTDPQQIVETEVDNAAIVEPDLAEVAKQPRPFNVSELNKTMYVSKDANVRSGPFNDQEVLATVQLNSAVNATGQVVATNWYQIALSDGRTGYVYGSLLTDEAPMSADVDKTNAQSVAASDHVMSAPEDPLNKLPETFVVDGKDVVDNEALPESLADPIETAKLEPSNTLPETTIEDRDETSESLPDPMATVTDEPVNALPQTTSGNGEELLEPLRDTIKTPSLETSSSIDDGSDVKEEMPIETPSESTAFVLNEEFMPELPTDSEVANAEETVDVTPPEPSEIVQTQPEDAFALTTGAIDTSSSTQTLAEKLSGAWYVSRVQIIENNLEQTRPVVAPFKGEGAGNELQIFEDDQLRYSLVLNGNEVVGTEYNRSCDKVTELPVKGTVSNENNISINYSLMMHGCGAVPATGTVLYELQRF